MNRPPVSVALEKRDRDALVVALAREVDEQQRRDRSRLLAYAAAAEPYVREFRRLRLWERPIPETHPEVVSLANQLLPTFPPPP